MTSTAVPSAGAGAAESTRGARWVALSGVLFSVLLAFAVLMTSGMPDTKDAAKVQAWDVKHTGLVGGSALVTMAAVIVGLYFLTWLYSHFSRQRAGWMGTLFLVGVVLFAGSGVLGAGVAASVSSDAKHLSVGSLQLLASLNQNLNYPMTLAGMAVMYLAAGFLIRRTLLLPGWLAWASWVLAVLSVSFFLGFVALIGTALWMIVVAGTLIARPPAETV